jgi:hypothetical protein
MTVLTFKVTLCSYIGFMLISKQKIPLYSENKIYVFCYICTKKLELYADNPPPQVFRALYYLKMTKLAETCCKVHKISDDNKTFVVVTDGLTGYFCILHVSSQRDVKNKVYKKCYCLFPCISINQVTKYVA